MSFVKRKFFKSHKQEGPLNSTKKNSTNSTKKKKMSNHQTARTAFSLPFAVGTLFCSHYSTLPWIYNPTHTPHHVPSRGNPFSFCRANQMSLPQGNPESPQSQRRFPIQSLLKLPILFLCRSHHVLYIDTWVTIWSISPSPLDSMLPTSDDNGALFTALSPASSIGPGTADNKDMLNSEGP